MTSSRKGPGRKAEVLHSRIVRSRLHCERCGKGGTTIAEFQCAHIVRRWYAATRCLEENGWCLCATCHHTVDEWRREHEALVAKTIGPDRYDELCLLAVEGPTPKGLTYWKAELARLEARCDELGISTKWKAA